MSRLFLPVVQRMFFIAAPFAICLMLLFPVVASAHTAHAILLRSDPAKDAILSVAPQQVRMWFSEDLNPVLSTAVVVNAENQRVDNSDAHVSSNDPAEMDVTLMSNLPPAVYIVVWRSDSNDDGHILRGSFIFTVARPDGTVPTLSGNTIPGQNALGGGNLTGLYTGQVDGPTLFNLIAITLVELGAVFWVGAQLWVVFVLQPVSEDHKEQSNTNQQVQLRFERLFSFPTLLVLLLANIGVLLGQALNFTGGQWRPAFALTLLSNLATSGRFGTFWMMREIVIGAALLLSLYMLFFKRRPKVINGIPHEVSIRAPLRSAEGIPAPQAGCYILPWANLILGLALFIAITMSSHAAAVSKNVVIYAVPIDWLHLLAAAFWVGGMMYIATTYLPVIHRAPIAERARSLITVLPYYTPWAIAGVAILAVTGPFSATFQLTSWAQFITTAYGRALAVKILLVGALLTTSAIDVGLLRPRLKKEYWKYTYIAGRVADDQATTESDRPTKLLAQQVKLREGRLSKKTRLLTEVLRWEPLLDVAVLVCVGLMNVFAGTLSPTSTQQQQPAGNIVGPLSGTQWSAYRYFAGRSFNTTVKTTDSKFTIMLNVNPNRFGTNIFTVSVVDNSTGKPTTNVGVSLYTTMLDMDMGTDTVNLLPDGKGHFSASGDLSMGGNYQIRIQIRTPNNTLHEARVQFYVPF
jgi:copper transport protein